MAATSHDDSRLADVIAAHPALGRFLSRELAYGQTRWAEIWLACIMAVFGAVLLAGGDTFSLPSYRIIRSFVTEDAAGSIAVAVGCLRLVALWYNGSRRRSPVIRVLGCASGFLFYVALTAGFALTAPPIPTGIIYGVLAVAELHSSGRAARDGRLLDSLGTQRRKRERDGLAPGD